MTDIEETLSRYFGYKTFRPGQEELVKSLLNGRDVLGVMPTGAGKSVCYQVPALMLEGITLVISPLISLMRDQVMSLVQSGAPAAYINSSLTYRQFLEVLRRMEAGAYKLVYVAPERLSLPQFQELCARLPIRLVAVDEAHCISQWGQDFRPDYLKIAEFLAALPRRPVVGAFTATATEQVKRDIVRALGLRDPLRVTTGFDRPNLYFAVREPKNKNAALLEELRRLKGRSGIIYCATRKKVEEVCELLRREGYDAAMYHAGLPPEERMAGQEDFLYDRRPVMVATNAFGMGIDKSNVSFVIHYNMPRSIEAYYQEAGRAGRDGSPADCILLYAPADVHLQSFLIEHAEPNPDRSAEEQEAARRQDHVRLSRMRSYATEAGCLRASILRYFGERPQARCENCSNCLEARRRALQSMNAPAGKTVTPEKKVPFGADTALFEKLRKLRLDLAREEHRAPFVIFSDATLRDMCAKRPLTRADFLGVAGMGRLKAQKYGDAFLALIREETPEGFRPAPASLAPGTAVRHRVFGGGTVLQSDRDRIMIRFEDGSTRSFVWPDAAEKGFLEIIE